MDLQVGDHVVPLAFAAIFLIVELRRNVHVPIREGSAQGVKPLRQAGFTGVDLLPTTNKTDDHGPVLMPVHRAD